MARWRSVPRSTEPAARTGHELGRKPRCCSRGEPFALTGRHAGGVWLAIIGGQWCVARAKKRTGYVVAGNLDPSGVTGQDDRTEDRRCVAAQAAATADQYKARALADDHRSSHGCSAKSEAGGPGRPYGPANGAAVHLEATASLDYDWAEYFSGDQCILPVLDDKRSDMASADGLGEHDHKRGLPRARV